jgi:hypothetical protein
MKKYNRIVYYNDNFSIAVINNNGKLRRIYCPFLIKCIKTISDIQENCLVYVDEVHQDPDDLIKYMIGGNLYPFKNFTISINF